MPPDENRGIVTWKLPEIVGMGLLLIYAILIVTGVVSACLLEATFGPRQVNGVSGFVSASVLGEAFLQGTFWAEPQVAVFFIIGSMGVGWWQKSSSRSSESDLGADQRLHARRAQMIVKLALAASILCAIGGVLFVVGQSLVNTPSDNWSSFSETLGVAIGSLTLGGLGVFVGARLLATHPTSNPGQTQI
jgi:nicotinamide riboside transporter PnuC